MNDAVEMTDIRNEFAAVRLVVRPYGRGTRLEVSSPQLGTTVLVDATVLEALTRMTPERLADLVGTAMLASDETVDDLTAPGDGGARPAT
jgi:hypothetical protein